MFNIFKNLFINKEIIKSDESYNDELCMKLDELASDDNLYNILFSSSAKLLILNTYTQSFEELIYNFTELTFNRQIIAVNINAYFNYRDTNFNITFGRLKDIATNCKRIPYQIKLDVEEIYSAYIYLKELEE